MRVAVEEWELYNNGILLCKWFDLEKTDLEEIENFISEIKKQNNLNHEDLEMFVADVYEDDLNIIKGDESLSFAFEVQDLRSSIEDCDLPKIAFLTSVQGYEIEEAIDKVDDCDYYENMSFEDLAEEFVSQYVMGDALAKLYEVNPYYIDMEAVARDLQYDYTEYNGDIFRCD